MPRKLNSGLLTIRHTKKRDGESSQRLRFFSFGKVGDEDQIDRHSELFQRHALDRKVQWLINREVKENVRRENWALYSPLANNSKQFAENLREIFKGFTQLVLDTKETHRKFKSDREKKEKGVSEAEKMVRDAHEAYNKQFFSKRRHTVCVSYSHWLIREEDGRF